MFKLTENKSLKTNGALCIETEHYTFFNMRHQSVQYCAGNNIFTKILTSRHNSLGMISSSHNGIDEELGVCKYDLYRE